MTEPLAYLRQRARFLAAAAFVVALLGPAGPAWGRYCGKPESTVCACNCNSKIEMIGVGVVDVAFSGHMGLYCVRKGVTAEGREFADMISTDFVIHGSHPLLGDIEVRIDRERFQELSNMTSLIPGSSFPARHEVLAHALVTFSSMPGVTWRTINSFRMRSDAVNSFSPAVNEHYELVEPVLFEDVAHPGVIVGKLLSASIVVDGSPSATARLAPKPAGGGSTAAGGSSSSPRP
ncbi:MAG: hypothetical protein U0002_11785 [Thermoanaerobaculia bacterium]